MGQPAAQGRGLDCRAARGRGAGGRRRTRRRVRNGGDADGGRLLLRRARKVRRPSAGGVPAHRRCRPGRRPRHAGGAGLRRLRQRPPVRAWARGRPASGHPPVEQHHRLRRRSRDRRRADHPRADWQLHLCGRHPANADHASRHRRDRLSRRRRRHSARLRGAGAGKGARQRTARPRACHLHACRRQHRPARGEHPSRHRRSAAALSGGRRLRHARLSA